MEIYVYGLILAGYLVLISFPEKNRETRRNGWRDTYTESRTGGYERIKDSVYGMKARSAGNSLF